MSTGKYGNWEPSVPHKLGDFGYIDKESGAFNCEGNIFEGEFAANHSGVLKDLGDPLELPPDNFQVITSANVKDHQVAEDLSL